jgi:hypothetical protein
MTRKKPAARSRVAKTKVLAKKPTAKKKPALKNRSAAKRAAPKRATTPKAAVKPTLAKKATSKRATTPKAAVKPTLAKKATPKIATTPKASAKQAAPKQKPLMQVPEEALRGVVRTNFDSPEPTAAQLDRKRRNTELLQELGLPTLKTLPVIEDESSVVPRSAEEIAERCLATAVCAMKGECGDQETMREIVERVGAAGLFSPEEQAFMDEENVSDQARAKFCWRYECMHVFLWALGYLPGLKLPHEIADVANEVKPIYEHGRAGLGKNARLRPLAEIFDQADLYYRLGWAAVEMRLKGETSDVANGEIIVERHRAFNWLIRYQGQDWDQVKTDT